MSLRRTVPGTGPATIERIAGVVRFSQSTLAGQSWGRPAESATVNIDLRGKVALVTGSSSGIGLGIARGLAKAGASVVVNGRSQSRADAAVNALKQAVAGADARGIEADVSTSEGCERLLKATPAVDILVNNAGIYEPKDFFEISDDDWTRYFQSNVMSGVRLSRGYLRGMLQSNWGRIVFISSESALYIPKEMIHYGFSKTAQLAVSRGLAELTAGSGVTVNALHPGWVATGFAKNNGPLIQFGISVFVPLFARTPQRGAETSIFLASSPDVAGITGKYFVDSQEVPSSPLSYDREIAEKLWEVSLELTTRSA